MQKHYKSVTWKHPLLSTADNSALVALRREAGLEQSCGFDDAASPCGWVCDYYGPTLSKDEQELLMLEEIK